MGKPLPSVDDNMPTNKAEQEANPVDEMVRFQAVEKWAESGEYLPEILRDFHDQKDIFKTMHMLYRDNDSAKQMPNWIDGQCYTVDWFLWYMAQRGYTLQKSRKQVEFKPLETWRDW